MTEQEKRRMQIAGAAKLDFEQRQEVERVMEWLADFPDEAATYIVWLEAAMTKQEKRCEWCRHYEIAYTDGLPDGGLCALGKKWLIPCADYKREPGADDE